MKTNKLLLLVLLALPMTALSSSVFAQSKGEMPFTSSSPNTNKLIRKAWVEFGDFRVEEGNQYVRQVLAEDPDCGMAYVFLYTPDPEEEKRNFQKAASLKLSADERMFLDGVMARRENKPTQKYFEPLVKKYPRDYYLQLWMIFNNSDAERAIQIGEAITGRSPKFAPTYNLLGYLYMGKRDLVKAEANFDRYISLQPTLANPYDSKGDLMMQAGKIPEAVTLYEKAASLGMSVSATKAAAARARLKFPAPSEAEAAVIKEIILATLAASKEGDVDALLRDYADQSIEIFGDQRANIGLPNLRRRVSDMFRNGGFTKQDFTAQGIDGAGPIAITYGPNKYTWKNLASGKESERDENAIFLLRKQADGKWKILADHFYESGSQALSPDDRKSINQLISSWDAALKPGETLSKQNFDDFQALYSPQAIEIFSNQVSNIGIANLRSRWEQYSGAKMETNSLNPHGVEGLGRRAVAWGIGNQNFYLKDSDELRKLEFPWAMILTKEKDDAWKILVMHWGAD